MEKWIDIKDYEGLYQVSNEGRIYSFISNRVIKGSKNSAGYIHLRLWKDNNNKTFKVHRIVAYHFIKLMEGKDSINHINGIKHDNRVENLEWCTQAENIQHSYRVLKNIGGFKAHPMAGAEKTSKKINRFSLSGVFIDSWKSIREASRDLNICRSSISDCCNGKIKTSFGYKWKFAGNA